MDTNASFLLRWRGRQQGPFTLAQIERKLAENEIGMLHEIQVGAEWVTLKSWIEKIDAERRTLAEQVGAPITQPTSRTTLHLADTGGRKRSATTGGAGTGLVRMPPDYELRIGDLVPRAWHAIMRCCFVTGLPDASQSERKAIEFGPNRLGSDHEKPHHEAISFR